MTQAVLSNEKYVFDASAQTITFYNTDFTLNKIKQITNVTDGIIIYCPQLGLLGTTVDNVLTLVYNTTSMSDTDTLQILYDLESNYQKSYEIDFTSVLAGIDTTFANLICTGSGMNISQTGGNLRIGTATTANAETIIRSKKPFSREWFWQFYSKRSQAIVNNYLSMQMVDIIGDGLTATSASATSATVTIPTTAEYYSTFAAILTQSINGMNGMQMFIGNCSSITGAIPGQYAIASATYSVGNPITLTFTVSGWSASPQSGSCTLYGWNWIHVYLNGATATTAYFDCGRNGWPSNTGDATFSINDSTTGSGYTVHKQADYINLEEGLISPKNPMVGRTTRVSSIPAEEVKLYIQIVARNGSTAPASNTNWYISGIRIEERIPQPVSIASIAGKQGTYGAYIPVKPFNDSMSVVVSNSISTLVTGYSGNVSSLPSTHHHLISANTTNATNVKGSAGNIMGGSVSNNGTGVAYLKLYNKASAPTVGTDTPIATILIPVNGTVMIGSIVPLGFRCGTGISYAITGGMAVSDTTAVGAAQVSVHLVYY
jgi:hypothetical protein